MHYDFIFTRNNRNIALRSVKNGSLELNQFLKPSLSISNIIDILLLSVHMFRRPFCNKWPLTAYRQQAVFTASAGIRCVDRSWYRVSELLATATEAFAGSFVHPAISWGIQIAPGYWRTIEAQARRRHGDGDSDVDDDRRFSFVIGDNTVCGCWKRMDDII